MALDHFDRLSSEEARRAGRMGVVELDSAASEVLAERWRLACSALALGSFQLYRDGSLRSSPELDGLCGLEAGSTLRDLAEFMDRVVVEERPAVLNTLTAPVGVGSSIELHFGLVRCDGELRYVQLRAMWVDMPAEPVLVGVVLEHHSEEASRLSDLAERYRTLADIIVVHQGGVIVYANPATIAHIRGKDASDVVGKPILDFFAPESRQAFIERVSMMAESHSVAAFSEERLIALDGTAVEIEATSILTTWEGRPAYQAVARVITDRKAAERKLREQAALIDAVSDAIIVCQSDDGENLRVVSWSKGAERMYGWEESEVLDRALHDVVGGSRKIAQAWWRRVLRNGVGAQETTHVRKDGSPVAVHVSATVLRDEAGQPAGAITVSTDISGRKAEESARRQLEERYSAVVAALEEGIIVVDTDGTIQAANAAAERILGASSDQLIGLDLAEVPWTVVDERGAPLAAHHWPAMTTLRSGRAQTNVVVGLAKPRGDVVWLSINSRPLSKTAGPGYPVVCSISDITDAKAARERLTYAATHDALTDLPNRAGMTEHLNRLAAEGVDDLAVLFVDLDRFKVINDSLGHTAGDRVLRATATRISDVVRADEDVVGRLAGDEFVVLCPNLNDPGAARLVADRLLTIIKEPLMVPDGAGAEHTVSIGASIGLAYLSPGELPVRTCAPRSRTGRCGSCTSRSSTPSRTSRATRRWSGGTIRPAVRSLPRCSSRSPRRPGWSCPSALGCWPRRHAPRRNGGTRATTPTCRSTSQPDR
jgi:diguanylate cyclase (GGDEF)-like protein/PAS domain S-box-containing protein